MYGGNSSEREISLISGINVGEALVAKNHKVDYIDTRNVKHLKKLFTKKYDIAYIALHGRGGEDGAIQGLLETINLKYTGSKIHASARCINKADTKSIYDRYGITNAPYVVVQKGKDKDNKETESWH